jgi:hypothetical protein
MDVPRQLEADVARLREETGYDVEIISEDGQLWILVKQAAIPDRAYTRGRSDVLMQTDFQYPMSAMDMFWMEPEVQHSNGSSPSHVSSIENHVGRSWRRWSWHRNGVWKPGTDDLITHWAFVEACWAAETPR